MSYNILKYDPYLEPYSKDIELRMYLFDKKLGEICEKYGDLLSFADSYKYFGFQKCDDGIVYREWAPSADAMYLTGDFNNWQIYNNPMKNIGNGVFEIYLSQNDGISVGQKVQAIVVKNGEAFRRVPSHATRVVQDKDTYLWCAELSDTLFDDFNWTDAKFTPPATPYIYECHIGMAQEEGKIGSYNEFCDNVLPKIKELGYNTIQIMAVMEHPYYASFGYQVSSFFAVSSRYGTEKDLKRLINKAHKMGIAVLLDIVHSHSIKNVGDGLNEFDTSDDQYFLKGDKGNHPAWDTKLFDYGKNEVVSFLLSNLKFYMEVYHFDGFRFDGVTSMLYHDHALGSAFTDYSMYFSLNTNTDAVTYLQLATTLVHTINKKAICIAEDMSGMPGMCLPIKDGGIGFDFRLSMGVPDLWIKFIKEYRDEDWNMYTLWYELNRRRIKEKNIGYAESHDQALVGDKTIMFRLCDAEMYSGMTKSVKSFIIDRGIALHKMIRLITYTLSGEGTLTFMGNEFGHPEWIDFPREGNNWSYHYCRRQWSLAERDDLHYKELRDFEKSTLSLIKKGRLLKSRTQECLINDNDKIIAYKKGKNLFVFNFSSEKSFEGYFVPTESFTQYKAVLSTDEARFGGFDRVDLSFVYKTEKQKDDRIGFKCYLPARTAIVFEELE